VGPFEHRKLFRPVTVFPETNPGALDSRIPGPIALEDHASRLFPRNRTGQQRPKMNPMQRLPAPDPDELSRESNESFDKARELVDELKIVQEHENAVLAEDPEKPPDS